VTAPKLPREVWGFAWRAGTYFSADHRFIVENHALERQTDGVVSDVARYVLADDERDRLRDAVIQAARSFDGSNPDIKTHIDALEAYEAKGAK
jgi:hypothetical protein